MSSTCAAGTSSAFGASSCATASAGTFAPSTKMPSFTTPSGMYSASSAQSPIMVPAGSYLTGTTATPVACTSNTFSPLGGGFTTAACNQATSGYHLTAASNVITTDTTCAWGTYIPTATVAATACTTCAGNKACSGKSAISCPSFFVAASAAGSCTQIRAGLKVDGTGTTACTGSNSGFGWSASSNCFAPTGNSATLGGGLVTLVGTGIS